MEATIAALVEALQNDLMNERKHMAFYLQASVMVQGLHREELGEFLLAEAQSEMKHVEEFSKLIVQLGGVPGQEVAAYPADLACPFEILRYAQEMEQEVADNYSERMSWTEHFVTGVGRYVHLFYEDQLQDSQEAALELALYIKPYLKKDSQCPQNTNTNT